MLEKLTYQNCKGETFTTGSGGIYANASDIHDYLWEYTTSDADKITRLKRGVVKRTIPLIIFAPSAAAGASIRNSLMEVAERDVLAGSPGKIIINGYYMSCYIIGSEKSTYLTTMQYMETSLTVLTDNPAWIKETTHNFYSSSTSDEDEDSAASMDFPYDYAYEYKNTYGAWKINNTSFSGSDFQLVIYGYAVNPAITIAGHVYSVEATINTGEYLVINSRDKTVYKVDSSGTVTNLYNARGKESSVFEAIPAGSSVVAWSGDWGFDITLYDERSEPEWSL